MGLAFWPIIIPIALLALGALFYEWRRVTKTRGRTSKSKKPLSFTEQLAKSPAYLAEYAKYLRLKRILTAVLSVLVVVLLVLSMRPSTAQIVQPSLYNRDIMLCLDISGSMLSYDKVILEVFSKLAKQFKGQRIGLTIFDSSPLTIFPLTDDSEFATKELAKMAGYMSFDGMPSWIFNGTGEGDGSSLIGDGLAGCALGFDQPNVQRSRSIILATDNYLAGTPIVSLDEAAAFTKSKSIRMYAIDTNYTSAYYNYPESTQFRDAALLTDGSYYNVNADGDSVDGIAQKVQPVVKQIDAQDATRFKGSPQLMVYDKPEVFTLIAAIVLVAYIWLTWRLKL